MGQFEILNEDLAPTLVTKTGSRVIKVLITKLYYKNTVKYEKLSAGTTLLIPNQSFIHKHPCDEIIYVISGSGTLKLESKTMNIREGDIMYIPENVTHGIRNNGRKVMKLFWVYTPAGPEEKILRAIDGYIEYE